MFIAGEPACDDVLNISEVCVSACEGEILKAAIQSTSLSIWIKQKSKRWLKSEVKIIKKSMKKSQVDLPKKRERKPQQIIPRKYPVNLISLYCYLHDCLMIKAITMPFSSI